MAPLANPGEAQPPAAPPSTRYRGRFAPSPTGPLHAGSLLAALASWLDARAHGGGWIVRIEDVDTPRCVPGADRVILQQLATCGLLSDETVVWQSQRGARYQAALDRLKTNGFAYPCSCSRKTVEIASAAQGLVRGRHQALVYPGTCRPENGGAQASAAITWRLHTGAAAVPLPWTDRRLGPLSQNLAEEVGDFILRRADGCWAYQLAAVVDDAQQDITHVVRGEDLTDNTPRQIRLQQALGLHTPRYLHTPLVLGENGEKLSKQNGAQALDLGDPLRALRAAATGLGLSVENSAPADRLGDVLAGWVTQWRVQWVGVRGSGA